MLKKTLLLSFSIFLYATQIVAQSFDGYALYNEQNNGTTYLIDKDGEIAHSWSCNTNCNYTVHLKEDGNLLRQGVSSSATLKGAAYGGVLQEYDKDANVVWEFSYSGTDYQSHHDFAVLPNGNVLLTAWETKSASEMTAAGYSDNSAKWPTHIIEVQQDGTGGKIVWEWHIWDHLIQDTDASKPNYGVVSEHPELMDINVATTARSGGPGGSSGDWFHVNGIDYNEDLDQIVFSSRYLSEIFIIDHSTTTAEAASHSGGNSGKGGDFLFRYGNPSNYGSTVAQSIPGPVHDTRWIKSGRPNEGYIQFFSNQGVSSNSSSVDAINPVMASDGYNYTFENGSFQPTKEEFRHTTLAYGSGQSASDRMTNGNIFVNISRNYMYEVDTNGNTVWQYSARSPKGFRYECAYPGVWALLGSEGCGTASVNSIQELAISVYPNPSHGVVYLENVPKNLGSYIVEMYNVYGAKISSFEDTATLDIRSLTSGTYMLKIVFENGQSYFHKVSLVH
ncbi:MAG: aryl-sulfate sulfotransferase [Bacteroidia bacterium]